MFSTFAGKLHYGDDDRFRCWHIVDVINVDVFETIGSGVSKFWNPKYCHSPLNWSPNYNIVA